MNLSDSILVCGSKQYTKISLDEIVDSFGVIVRNNMNIPGLGYGRKDSTYQILNGHVFKNHQDLDKLLSFYARFTDQRTIKAFYEYLRGSEVKVLSPSGPESGRKLQSYLRSKGIQIEIKKELRCGLRYMTELLIQDRFHHLIGFSLTSEEYERHQINVNLKQVNDKHHDRDVEIQIVKALHEHKLIDASLCALIDTKIPTLNSKLLTPTQNSIELLRRVCGEIKIV